MKFTVADALKLSDVWHLPRVTVSGFLYANGLISVLVDQKDQHQGIILLSDSEKEMSICERLFECGCGPIGGGTVMFLGPATFAGKLSRWHFPMVPLSMAEIGEIHHRGHTWQAPVKPWQARPHD
jgi:hypothetical protein